MKNRLSATDKILRGLLLAIAFASSAQLLRAQCLGVDADALGCPTDPLYTPDKTSPTGAINIAEPPKLAAPKADASTSASAKGSLTEDSAYAEDRARSSLGAAPRSALLVDPPEPPTDFQRFVSATTGKMLPIFGGAFFSAARAPTSRADRIPAPRQMRIGADDELRIRVWGQVNFSANLIVSRQGEIYLPKVGAVRVAGLSVAEAPEQLRKALDRVYRNYELSVDFGAIHSIQIYIAGYARRPGQYTVSALSTLVDALIASGGPAASGSMRHALLKRAGKTVVDFDLYALLLGGDKSGDRDLEQDDVLFLPACGAQAALLGSVRQSAIYELRGGETAGDLLALAGGETAVAASARISLERIEDHARRRSFALTGDATGLATPLTDGDILRIDPIPSLYRETVTLRGSVANPGRFLWRSGMRLSDLLPDRETLTTPGYWWRRTQLGLPGVEIESHPDSASATDRPAALESPRGQTDWNYAVVERLDPTTMKTALHPFHLGKLIFDHDPAQNLELRPGDVVTIFSEQDIRAPLDEQTKYVRLEGEFAHPGVYSVTSGETLRSLVERAGGFTAKAYLYATQFTRASAQAAQQQRLNEYADQLERQLQHASLSSATTAYSGMQALQSAAISREIVDRLRRTRASGRIVLNLSPASRATSDLPTIALEDGDRLLVPPTPETVLVFGAVYNPGAFLYAAGGDFQEYLQMAGGPNRDADKRRAYLLRANGSVYTPEALWSNLGHQPVHPGDTLIVPEKGPRGAATNAFLNWAQAAQNLTLSAAAIDLLKR